MFVSITVTPEELEVLLVTFNVCFVKLAEELVILVPKPIMEKLRKIEQELGVPINDIVLRAIVKVLEEFEKL